MRSVSEISPRPQRADVQGVRRRGNTTRHVIGAIYLGFAAAAVLFALGTWWAGRLNPINLLVFALATAGTLPVGLLAWQGDFLGSPGMDEGQREMSRAAQSDAFNVAYLGLYAPFFATIFFPQLQSAVTVGIGVLLLLVTLTWAGGYMWRRWRP